MAHRWRILALLNCLALVAGSERNWAWGQILAMPPSTAEEAPAPDALDGSEPAEVYVPPGTGPTLLVPGTGYAVEPGGVFGRPLGPSGFESGPWSWELLPAGLIYRPYLADPGQPRLAGQFFHEPGAGWLLDATVGARVGLLRYGTPDPVRPEGWQLDFEAAVFPRIALDGTDNLLSTDYRYGVPLAFRHGMLETKLAFAHLSSHLADEFIATHPGAVGNEYVRDAIVLGAGLRPTDCLRLYAEAGWGFRNKGPAKPWEFQFGAELSPSGATGWRGTPFLAVHGHIREEVDFGGSLTAQAGWQWRGRSGHLLRTGFHYFNGKSDQMQFLNKFEQQIGAGIWYDF